MTTKRLGGLVLAIALAGTLSACSSDEDVTHETEAKVDINAAPSNASWDTVHGLKLPSADQGPEETQPVRFGYDQSAQGAVLAAMNTQGQLAVADDQTWPEVSRINLAPGKGRDQWAQQRALISVKGNLKKEQAPRFEGFKVTDFSDDGAVVVLAVDYPDIGLAAYPVQLQYRNDDWRVILPSQEDDVKPKQLENLDGFTPFSAKENNQ